MSVAARAGRAIERRNTVIRSAEAVSAAEGNTERPLSRGREGSAASKNPGTQARTYVHAGDLRGLCCKPVEELRLVR